MLPSIPHGGHRSRPYLFKPHERPISKTCGRNLPVSSGMLDWLAVGWNLAMTISGAFLVSLSFRTWPLRFSMQNRFAPQSPSSGAAVRRSH